MQALLKAACLAALVSTMTVAQAEPGPQTPSLEREIVYRILVAELAGKRGQIELALDNYRAAAHASLDPQVAERALAVAMFAKHADAALEMARRWYALAPETDNANRALALLLLRSNAPQALEQLDKLRQMSSHDGQEGFSAVAVVLSQIEDKQQVLDILAELHRRYPRDVHAPYYQALTYLGLKQSDAALVALRTAMEINPKWPPAMLLYAQVLVENQQLSQAREFLYQAVQQQPEVGELRYGYARVLVSNQQNQAAAEQFRWLAEHEPKNSEYRFALGLLAMDAKQYPDAQQHFQQALALGHDAAETYVQLGRSYEAQQNYEQARSWYNKVPVDSEKELNAQVLIGGLLLKQGKVAAMEQHFAQLRQRYSEQADLLFVAEAEALHNIGDEQAAYTVLDKAVGLYPDNSDLRYARALAAERIDRLDVLESDLRYIIEREPENAHALNALGYTLADRTDRHQEALGYLEQALKLLPDDAAVIDSMGWIKYRLGDTQAALEYLRQAYARNQDGEIVAHLAEVLWVSAQQEEALKVWREASQRLPDDRFLKANAQRFGWSL